MLKKIVVVPLILSCLIIQANKRIVDIFCWGGVLSPWYQAEVKRKQAAGHFDEVKEHFKWLYEISSIPTTKIPYSFTLDTRPYGRAEICISPEYKNRPDLYAAIETHEKTHFEKRHMQKESAFLGISAIACHLATSPILKIKHPIAYGMRLAGTFSAFAVTKIFGLPLLRRFHEKQADSAITDPIQIEAFANHISSTRELFPKKTGWLDAYPCPDDRVKLLNDRLAKMQSEKP